MIKINLGRLIAKKEISALIQNVTRLSDEPIWVTDSEDKVLYGSVGQESTAKHPVSSNELIIGWVSGGQSAGAVANLLTYICSVEFEKKTLGTETLEKYKEITLLYDMAEKLVARLEPKEVASLLISEIKRLIFADSVSVMFYDSERDILQVIAVSGQDSFAHSAVFKLGEGIAGHVALTGKAEIINDVTGDARFIDKGIAQVASLICAPLKVKDNILGVVNVSSREPYPYKANDLKILSALAFQASAAVENARLYGSLKEAFITMVHTLAETIEKRDPYTGGHIRRVKNYCIAVGEILGMANNELEKLQLGAVLHDIGKIGVRDNVLLKPGRLSDEEFAMMKMHAIYGEDILKHIKYLHYLIPSVRHHHERFDGHGYPDCIEGEEIDLFARIIAVADTFDAMTSDRPYRKALPPTLALEEIMRNAGSQFDPMIVQAFISAYELGKFLKEDE